MYKPDPMIQPFVDIYWFISGYNDQTESLSLLPGGGVNLMVNLGAEILSTRFKSTISHEKAYFVGPMKQSDIQLLRGEINMFGISFKPGAFSHFYKFESLHSVTDQFFEFNTNDFPDIKKTIQYLDRYLNQFYIERLTFPKNSILNVINDISIKKGKLKIENLTKNHFITERQIERQFKKQLGLSPKEYMNLERFNHAFTTLQKRNDPNLSEIVWKCGYYDNAHMTNDFKKYTGKTPSDYILSDISKIIAS